jgi:hypothetical protein
MSAFRCPCGYVPSAEQGKTASTFVCPACGARIPWHPSPIVRVLAPLLVLAGIVGVPVVMYRAFQERMNNEVPILRPVQFSGFPPGETKVIDVPAEGIAEARFSIGYRDKRKIEVFLERVSGVDPVVKVVTAQDFEAFRKDFPTGLPDQIRIVTGFAESSVGKVRRYAKDEPMPKGDYVVVLAGQRGKGVVRLYVRQNPV